MKITSKIATSGTAGMSRFPIPNADIDECRNDKGFLDEMKVRSALSVDQIQIGQKDDKPVVVFAIEYLHQLRSVVTYMSDHIKTANERERKQRVHAHADSAADKRCERRLNKGRHAFATTVITSCLDGLHVKLSYANPRGVVGDAERLAHDYTVMCARILIYLQQEVTACKITLIEGENCAGILEEARKDNAIAEEYSRRKELSAMRVACPNRQGGFCSPSNPKCSLYCNGRCLDPMEDAK